MFFDDVDDSSARQAFLDKGWLMSLVEPKPGQVELRWTPVAGGETRWVGLDYNHLCSMGADKARAIAWLGLFADQEDNIN